VSIPPAKHIPRLVGNVMNIETVLALIAIAAMIALAVLTHSPDQPSTTPSGAAYEWQ
jgi:hypothetical protein